MQVIENTRSDPFLIGTNLHFSRSSFHADFQISIYRRTTAAADFPLPNTALALRKIWKLQAASGERAHRLTFHLI